MSYTGSFNQAAYQKRIDDIVGTRNGRSLIKLGWIPDELRWMPHKLGTDPPGYAFPIFCNGKDAEGKFIVPERWALLERVETAQFAPTPQFWEDKRYVKQPDGSVWDVKGPCPSERYIELRCHSYHDGECCKCVGDSCECGEQYEHCWGKYAEPDEHLLNWIRKAAWEARQDSDVKPDEDIRGFAAPNAQREVKNTFETLEEKKQIEQEAFDREAVSLWLRQPVTTSGLKQTESGIYYPE